MNWLDRLVAERAEEPEPEEAWPFDPTLEALCFGLPPEDAQVLREERAGILEHQAVLTRGEAERKAGIHPARLG